MAEEVRNLAQRSAQAAKTTSKLISTGKDRANRGVQLTETTQSAIDKIVSSSEQVSLLIKEITAATAEQANEIEQVNGTTQKLDKVTNHISSSAEETANVSDQLSSQLCGLNDMIAQLRSVVGSSETATYQSQSAPIRPLSPRPVPVQQIVATPSRQRPITVRPAAQIVSKSHNVLPAPTKKTLPQPTSKSISHETASAWPDAPKQLAQAKPVQKPVTKDLHKPAPKPTASTTHSRPAPKPMATKRSAGATLIPFGEEFGEY